MLTLLSNLWGPGIGPPFAVTIKQTAGEAVPLCLGGTCSEHQKWELCERVPSKGMSGNRGSRREGVLGRQIGLLEGPGAVDPSSSGTAAVVGVSSLFEWQ